VPEWSKTFVQEGPVLSAGYFALDSVEAAPDGDVIVGGRFTETLVFDQTTIMSAAPQAFVGRLDGETGSLKWLRGLGDLPTDDHPSLLAVDDAGAVYVANEFAKSFSFAGKSIFPNGPSEIFIAKIDAAGQPVWITSMGTGGIDFPSALVAIDSLGLVAIGGKFKGTMSVPRVGGADVLSSKSTGADVFIVRLAVNNGLAVNSQGLGGNGNDDLLDLAVDGQALLAVGVFGASIDLGGGPLPGSAGSFVLAQTAAGQYTGSFSLLQAALQPEHIRASADGALWLSGQLDGQAMLAGALISGANIGFAVKLTRSGEAIRAFSFGGPGTSFGSAMVVDRTRAVVTGGFSGLATFADETLTAVNQSDAFVYAFVP
jgi:hypothetical protein